MYTALYEQSFCSYYNYILISCDQCSVMVSTVVQYSALISSSILTSQTLHSQLLKLDNYSRVLKHKPLHTYSALAIVRELTAPNPNTCVLMILFSLDNSY